MTVAGKGCVGIFREAALMQMISGKREPVIIHENLRRHESICALIGCKEAEPAVEVREGEGAGRKRRGFGQARPVAPGLLDL